MTVVSLPVPATGTITIPKEFWKKIPLRSKASILIKEENVPEEIAILEEVSMEGLSEEDHVAISEGRKNKANGKTLSLQEFFETQNV